MQTLEQVKANSQYGREHSLQRRDGTGRDQQTLSVSNSNKPRKVDSKGLETKNITVLTQPPLLFPNIIVWTLRKRLDFFPFIIYSMSQKMYDIIGSTMVLRHTLLIDFYLI